MQPVSCVNRNLEQCSIDERIDHRSFADRGIDEQPTIHEGVVARALEAKGIISDRCELNRQIKEDNRLLRALKADVKRMSEMLKNSILALAEAFENLRSKMIVLCYKMLSNAKRKNTLQH
ncbi:MAG: mobilization protein, partial [Bacteroidetes bacterium]|nr:mobilization protein [Bacteroidota bacterium]